MQRMPFGFDRIDDEITCFLRAAKRYRQRSPIFIDNPTWDVRLLTSQIMIIRLVVAARHATTCKMANFHRRFTIDAPASGPFRRLGFFIFFLLLSKIASVSLIFFWGLVFTTLRKR